MASGLHRLCGIIQESKFIGTEWRATAFDVPDRATARRLRDTEVKKPGMADILVNTAGITSKGSPPGVYKADWAQVTETGLAGTLRAGRSLAAHIRGVSGGVIFRLALMFRTSARLNLKNV